MRVKLYLLSLLPSTVGAGWLTSELARILGPRLIAPRDIAFLVVMTFVAAAAFGLLNLILFLLLGLRLVQKDGGFVLAERSRPTSSTPT